MTNTDANKCTLCGRRWTDPGATVGDVCRAALLLGYMPRFVFEAAHG